MIQTLDGFSSDESGHFGVLNAAAFAVIQKPPLAPPFLLPKLAPSFHISHTSYRLCLSEPRAELFGTEFNSFELQ